MPKPDNLHEIIVVPKQTSDDIVGHEVRNEALRSLAIEFDDVTSGKIYRVEGVSEEEATILATGLFVDPIIEQGQIRSADLPRDGVEVAYNPGAMNPESGSIIKAASDMNVGLAAADSSTEYVFFGGKKSDVARTLSGLLVNETIQHVVAERPATLLFEGKPGGIQTVPLLEASENELMELSKDKLFLDLDEMAVIQTHFRSLGRNPTDGELEHLASATMSEHCMHKTFKARITYTLESGEIYEKDPLMDRIVATSKRQPNFDRLVDSAFHDNSGVMKFYEGQAVCGKVETHNSPSAIEPYGGAMTGSGGVFRDIMGTGQGAEVIISTDMFCFAPWTIDQNQLKPGTLHPDYLQRRVVQGVRDYGNRTNIPTVNGSVHYHPDFQAKPTVIVGAYGILPEARAQKGVPQIGDKVVVFGGRTGRDGIHGATFSSGEMTNRTVSINSSAVQIGNPIEEIRMSDALLEARDMGYIRAITDCGAAGFASAIGEMASDIGVTVDISKAPLKYQGLAPWEVWISESQERMVASVAPDDIKGLMEVCKEYNVEATVLGEFDGSNTLTVNYGGDRLIKLDYDFLENGLPQRTMNAKEYTYEVEEKRPEAPKTIDDWGNRFRAILAHGNVASKEPITRQYDQGVKGGNIVPAFGGKTQQGPNDAHVMRPVLGKSYGVVVAHGMNPILNRIDPYWGTVWAVAESLSNLVAVGGNIDEAAAVGNYIWPKPDQRHMGALDRAVDAACDMMDITGVPVISGKDSLSSTYTSRNDEGEIVEQINIPPVYTSSIFGRIPDVEQTVTSAIKQPGKSRLYLVGKPSQNLGGSTYYDVAGGQSSDLPKVDLDALPKTLRTVHALIANGNVLACHDVSEGGVATAVAEMCFGGDSGASLSLPNSTNKEAFLFAESAGCFVVEVALENETQIKSILKDQGVNVRKLGQTRQDKRFSVTQWSGDRGVATIISEEIDQLKVAWQAPLKEVFHG